MKADTGHFGDAVGAPLRNQRFALVALLMVAGFQLASGILFASTVRHQVFDEGAYAEDIRRYQIEGISRGSLRAQVSASGPVVTVASGLAARLAPGDVRAWRIPVLLSWFAILATALLLALRLGDPGVTWSLCLLFAFPHVPTAIGSVLTEGPAMAGIMVALAFTVAGLPAHSLGAALVAGLSTGIALLCRQYALAFTAGVCLTWLSATRRLILSAVTGAGPLAALAVLFLVWGGLLSPSFKAGGGPELQTTVGLNLWRPFSAATYVGLYMAPLVLFARSPIRWRPLAGGVVLAVGCVALGFPVLGNGPVLTLVRTAAGGRSMLLHSATVLVLAVGLGSLLTALVDVLPRLRPTRLAADPLLFLSVTTVVFFILQQAAVGGSSPFFERYVFLVSPFLFLWGLRAGDPGRARLAVFACFSLLAGQAMLWRHA